MLIKKSTVLKDHLSFRGVAKLATASLLNSDSTTIRFSKKVFLTLLLLYSKIFSWFCCVQSFSSLRLRSYSVFLTWPL